jgi:hypothetical protein
LLALSVLSPQPASAAVPVPTPITNWIGKHLGQSVLKSLGYNCYGIVCVVEGSYDPPRWGRGVAATGGPVVNARSWTSTRDSIVRTFPNGWKLTIFCQQTGDWVYGRWGWTNVWDYVGQQGDTPRFVSDGFVNTGTNGFVAGSCTSTNYGGMWK